MTELTNKKMELEKSRDAGQGLLAKKKALMMKMNEPNEEIEDGVRAQESLREFPS